MSDGISQAYRDAEEADRLRTYRILALESAIAPSPEATGAAMAAYREYHRDERFHGGVAATLERLASGDRPSILRIASLLRRSGYSTYDDRERGVYPRLEALLGIRFANTAECGAGGHTRDAVSAFRLAILRAFPDASGEDEFTIEIPPEVADLVRVTRTRKARRDAN